MRAGPVLLVGMLAFTSEAAAQAKPPSGDGLDGHGFVPAPIDGDVRDPLVVQRVGDWSPQTAFVAGLLEYADGPLMWCSQYDDDLGCLTQEALLDDVIALNTVGGYALTERIRFFGSMPLYFSTHSDHSTGGGGVGDIRLGMQAAFLRDGPVYAGVTPWLDLPSGDDTRFQGEAGASGGASLAGGIDLGPIALSSELGAAFGPPNAFEPYGDDSLLIGLGVGYAPTEDWGVTVESRMTPRLLSEAVPGTGMPSELYYSFRQRLDDGLHFHLAAANALSPGPRVARMRIMAGLGWTATSQVDLDGDGILHEDDRCPRDAEIVNGWQDADGCPEDPVDFTVETYVGGRLVRDAQVIVLGAVATQTPGDYVGDPGTQLQLDARWGGCRLASATAQLTPDTGTLPLQLKVQHGTLRIAAHNGKNRPIGNARITWLPGPDAGCHPTDNAQLNSQGRLTTVVGATDQRFVVTAPGYGSRVFTVAVAANAETFVDVLLEAPRTGLTRSQITLSDTLWFHYNSAGIHSDSERTLEEVAAELLSHPELGVIQVVGHTDDQGTAEFNMDLSIRRAEAATARLVKYGVPAERLEVVGRGATEPVSNNRSRRGRAKNRRVEFLIPAGGGT